MPKCTDGSNKMSPLRHDVLDLLLVHLLSDSLELLSRGVMHTLPRLPVVLENLQP